MGAPGRSPPGGHVNAISFITCALMLCLATLGLPKSETRRPAGQKPDTQPDTRQGSAEQAFARLKTLAGNWKGQASMGPQPGMMAPVRVSLRVTSGGSALM